MVWEFILKPPLSKAKFVTVTSLGSGTDKVSEPARLILKVYTSDGNLVILCEVTETI